MGVTDPAHRELPEVEYRRMALILRAGLLVSLAILVGGILAYVVVHPGVSLASALSNNPILGFLELPGLASGLLAGNPAAYLTVGLIALVLTPVLRVLTGFYYFHQDGERGMATITLVVLLLLLLGLLVVGPLIR
jgi:uncharacterized membrane protein